MVVQVTEDLMANVRESQNKIFHGQSSKVVVMILNGKLEALGLLRHNGSILAQSQDFILIIIFLHIFKTNYCLALCKVLSIYFKKKYFFLNVST